MNMDELLSLAIKESASDLHLTVNKPIFIRVDGELRRVEYPYLDQNILITWIQTKVTTAQWQQFLQKSEIDFAFELTGIARIRANLFWQDNRIAIAMRLIQQNIPTLEQLELPEICKEICKKTQGLVLVTGATGSGKTSTLAAMLNFINCNMNYHIITLEDPIEFLHQNEKSLIHQREIHQDTKGFHQALKAALRADPDVIMIGELRDQETIQLALTAAETGHLVFATLHTASAAKSVSRVIDVFSAEDKVVARSSLSNNLEAVISQTLEKRKNKGRVAVMEIMLCNSAIRNLIREDKISQIYSAIQTGQQQGMMTMAQHRQRLVRENILE